MHLQKLIAVAGVGPRTALAVLSALSANELAQTIEEGDRARLQRSPGVGRKTANLVLTQGFAKPGICVDTHVHRISNRWGYVATKSPNDTETALRAKLPRRYWIEYNDLLVAFGQTLCKPISPLCDTGCPVGSDCPRLGVEHHR